MFCGVYRGLFWFSVLGAVTGGPSEGGGVEGGGVAEFASGKPLSCSPGFLFVLGTSPNWEPIGRGSGMSGLLPMFHR